MIGPLGVQEIMHMNVQRLTNHGKGVRRSLYKTQSIQFRICETSSIDCFIITITQKKEGKRSVDTPNKEKNNQQEFKLKSQSQEQRMKSSVPKNKMYDRCRVIK